MPNELTKAQTTESWQEKFYKLAELYLNSESLLKYSLNKLLKARAEIERDFRNDLSPEQCEAFNIAARTEIGKLIEGSREGSVDKQIRTKPLDVRKMLDIARNKKRKPYPTRFGV